MRNADTPIRRVANSVKEDCVSAICGRDLKTQAVVSTTLPSKELRDLAILALSCWRVDVFPVAVVCESPFPPEVELAIVCELAVEGVAAADVVKNCI